MIFTPDETAAPIAVPSIEEARADYAPGYGTTKGIDRLKAEVLGELNKLGASGFLVDGVYRVPLPGGKTQKRFGYELRLSYRNGLGVIRVAGLPIAGAETPAKVRQVRAQALYNLHQWLQTSVTMQVFGDRGAVLVPYMIPQTTDNPDGKTVAELIYGSGDMPSLLDDGL